MLSIAEIRSRRLRSLLLAGPRGLALGPAGEGAVERVVTHMGAMQAQDHQSGLWSLGARLPGMTRAKVEAALDHGEALRTWPMRGTVHLVPSRDAAWMLELMSAKPLAGGAARRAQLGLTLAVVDRAADVLREALTGRRLTRKECLNTLTQAGIEVTGQRGYHLLWYASQVGVTCIAGQVGKEQAFALLSEWAPDPVLLSRDDALAEIAARYVRSHGPATEKDLARWTGLGLRDCRAGIAGAGDRVVRVDTAQGTMLASPAALEPLPDFREVLALPGFDELVLGYADRTAQLDKDHEKQVVPGGNGVFRATFVRGGRVVATWTRTMRARAVAVEATDLSGLSARERTRCEAALEPYGRFVGLPVEVRWTYERGRDAPLAGLGRDDNGGLGRSVSI